MEGNILTFASVHATVSCYVKRRLPVEERRWKWGVPHRIDAVHLDSRSLHSPIRPRAFFSRLFPITRCFSIASIRRPPEGLLPEMGFAAYQYGLRIACGVQRSITRQDVRLRGG